MLVNAPVSVAARARILFSAPRVMRVVATRAVDVPLPRALELVAARVVFADFALGVVELLRADTERVVDLFVSRATV